MIQRQQTVEPSSNTIINRPKNVSAPQKLSIDQIKSEGHMDDLKQTPHQLPMGVKSYGGIQDDSHGIHPDYSTNQSSNIRFLYSFFLLFLKINL
jgi:hypothetical protein